MITAFYVLNFLCLFGVDIKEAKELTTKQEYEKSAYALSFIRPTADNYKQYCYLQACNYFALNDKNNCSKWLRNYKDSFSSAPRRYEVLVDIMQESLLSWKEGDLADIERDMRNSVARLSNSRSGEETQRIQKQIVDKLNKLIEEEENKNKGDSSSESSSALPKSEQNPQPQEDSRIMGGSGAGETVDRILKQYAEKWGSLPPAKRASVMREIEMQIPKQYHARIEEYMRNINRFRK